MNVPPMDAAPLVPPDASPLSEKLRRILAAEPPPGGLTVNTLLTWTQGRGLFLLIVLLCLPFLAPASLPGLSTPLGLVIALLALRWGIGLPPRLPRWVGERALPPQFNRVLNGAVRVLEWIERWLVRPRRTAWMSWRAARLINSAALAVLGLYLALPLAIPFTNFLPAYGILFLSLALMEEDGLLVWVGYGVGLASLIYLGLVADVALRIGLDAWTHVLAWWKGAG